MWHKFPKLVLGDSALNRPHKNAKACSMDLGKNATLQIPSTEDTCVFLTLTSIILAPPFGIISLLAWLDFYPTREVVKPQRIPGQVLENKAEFLKSTDLALVPSSSFWEVSSLQGCGGNKGGYLARIQWEDIPITRRADTRRPGENSWSVSPVQYL